MGGSAAVPVKAENLGGRIAAEKATSIQVIRNHPTGIELGVSRATPSLYSFG
jgi:hypothetical protein